MATNYSPTIVTDGAVFVGDARMPSISEPGTRLYNRAGVDSADVKLLIHGNVGSGQSFSDSSLSNHAITAGGDVTHSATQSKFSGGSIYWDDAVDFLKIASSSDWAFTGDFTVDLWIYPQDTGSGNLVGDYYIGGASTSPDWQFIYNGANQRVNMWRGSVLAASSTDSVPRNQWTHVALVRSGSGTNNCKIYVNGILDGQDTFTTTVGRGLNLWVGIDGNESAEPYLGYMDEVRITKGVALWTQDFTPPARRNTLSISDGMMYNGSCLDFDGSNDYVIANYSSNLDITGNFTQVAWVKIDTNSTYNSIISWGEHAISKDRTMWIQSGTGKLCLYFYGTSTNMAVGTSSLDDGAWHFCVATWDGTYGNIYVDGAFEDRKALTALSYTYANTSIGRNSANAYFFDGQIADAKIFDVALSLSQIKELYNDSKVIAPSNVSQTNLKLWCPLVDGAGGYAYDGSGNGNDGTLTNMDAATDWLTGQTGAPQLVQGYNRKAVFEDSTDYVTAAGPAVTGDLSVSAWIYRFSDTLSYAGVVAKMGGSSTNGWMFRFDSSHQLEFMILRSGVFSGEGSVTLSNNTWHHVVGTNDGTNLKVYVDGSLGSTVASGGATIDSGTGLQIGTYGYGGGNTYPFYGIVDEAIVYDKALSLAEVQALAATGPNGGPLPPDPMSLSNSSSVVGYWRNDGNVTWTDRSSNSNNGTVTGSPDALLFKQGVNGSASTSTGRDNQGFPLKYKDVGAIGFNGSDDYIDCGDLGTIGDRFTYSVWFKTGPSTVATYRMFICVDGNTNGNPQLRIYNGNVQMRFYSDNSLASSGTYWDGEWHQAVGGINGSGDYFLYVDGVSQGTLTPASYTVSWSGNTRIGKYNYDGGKFFEGQIGNARIYNRFLSHAEIKQNYNAQKSRFT